MYTTIKISSEMRHLLNAMKIVGSETYESVIEDLVEDHAELNPNFRKSLEKAMAEYRKGRTVSFADIKKKLTSG